MTAIELLRICDKILKSMSEIGLRISDYRHVQMYDEYTEMVREGHKKEYVRTILADCARKGIVIPWERVL